LFVLNLEKYQTYLRRPELRNPKPASS